MNLRRFAAQVGVLMLLPAVLLAQPQLNGTLIVANRAGGSISFIDLPGGIEMARYPIGARIPHEVAVSPNGRLALSSEYGTAQQPGRTVLVFDVQQGALLGSIDLGPATRPHSLAFLPDSRRAVVTMEQADGIALIDVLDRRIIDKFAVGGSDNHMVRLSPDGATAYVTGRGDRGTLSVVDLRGIDETVVIETGAGAEGLAVSPDGSEVWVANRLAGTLSVVDTRSRSVVATLDAPPFAGRLEMSASGRVLVANGGFGGNEAAQMLTVFDQRTREMIAQHRVRQPQDSRGGFNLYVIGEQAVAADRTGNAILQVPLDDVAQFAVLLSDHDAPDGLAFSPLRMSVMND